MTAENQQTILGENTPEVPSDSELFAGEVHEELSERQVFAGDEDFYKHLADSVQPAMTRQPVGTSLSTLVHKRFSAVQKVLVVSIALIGVMLLYALLKSLFQERRDYRLAPTSAVQQTPDTKLPVEVSTPLSLKVAQNFYLNGDYDKAYAAYNQLRQSLPTGAVEELLKDFLQLKMALCMKKIASRGLPLDEHTADASEQANRLLGIVSQSRSPVVRTVANYHRSLIEMQKKQYLKARTRAYQVIALINAVHFDRDWALSLQRDCHFLAAESMTRNVLSLCDADKDLPEELWSIGSEVDPFDDLSEAQLLSFLNSGSKQLSKAMLGPQIQKLEHQDTSPRWFAVCHGASIEELLARFAANAGLDIHWAFEGAPAWEAVKDTARDLILQRAAKWDTRKRPVSLYMPATTTQQFVTVTAGCAGLLAHLDDNKVINVRNPADYSSLSEHISLLSQEAISLWQRFLLTFHGDKRIHNAHFALGVLQAQKGQVNDAVAEYKLVANRFSQTSLAPFALLYSSKLKTSLHDYFGARQDLMRLVEQYPDTGIAGRACLYLAEATMKAQLYDEATQLYRKVYNLAASLESQTASALGAGRCFYEIGDCQSAVKWLTRYIDLAKDHTSTGLHSAYFLLGRANLALGKPQQACDAFQCALAAQPSKEEYVEIVSALVKGHIEQRHFVEALDILESIPSWQFSQKESIEILLLKSKILRAMGLVDKAIVTLGDRAEYISHPQLKAEISFELTKCYIAKGNLELARNNLTEILVLAEPGPLAHEIALELADVCLKLGQNAQTISICSQLLDLGPSAQIKQKTLNTLATAYHRQKNYDRAASALLGQWNGAKASNEKRTFDNRAGSGQSPVGVQ